MFALCSLPSDIVNFYRASLYHHFRRHVRHIVVTGSRTICTGSLTLSGGDRHEGLIFRSISLYVSSHKNDQIWHGNTRGGATFWWGHKKGTPSGATRSVPQILGPPTDSRWICARWWNSMRGKCTRSTAHARPWTKILWRKCWRAIYLR